MQNEVELAVVLVVYNRLHPDCLPSLQRALELCQTTWRVVVVDNASDALDTPRVVRAQMPEAVLIRRNKNKGFGHACNRGAREVDARYYFFLNPDTVIQDEHAVATLLTFLRAHPLVGIVAPKIRYLDGRYQETRRRFPAWFMPLVQRTRFADSSRGVRYRDRFLMRDVPQDEARVVDWVQGSALLVDGDLFREMGGFDERYFMYFEDVDLCRESWRRGRPVYSLPSATVLHEYGQGSAKEKGWVASMVRNRLARAHVNSWWRYVCKWGTRV